MFENGLPVKDQYYGPPDSEYYEDLKELADLAGEIVKTAHSAGDVSYDRFKSWHNHWERAYDRVRVKYYDYRKEERDAPYQLLDSRKVLLDLHVNAGMCESNLWGDDNEKRSAQRSEYAQYTGESKKSFWSEWNEFLQNYANLKKVIEERR